MDESTISNRSQIESLFMYSPSRDRDHRMPSKPRGSRPSLEERLGVMFDDDTGESWFPQLKDKTARAI